MDGYLTDVGPTIGLVVPNFNDARHIVRCLKSILEQDVLPDELIVVDDCSTDDSVEVIQSLLNDHERVKFIKNPKNLGVYGALDVGARHVSSEYIMFVAANDFVFPGIFVHAKWCLAQHRGAGLWSAMGWLLDDYDRPIRPLAIAVPALTDRYFSPTDCIGLAKRFGNWFAGPTIAYHKQTLESVGRFKPAYRGLADLICALMVASKRGAIFSPVPYAVFRMHEGSYLSATLANPTILVPLLKQLIHEGPSLAPDLFDAAFSQRTVRRFVFSAIKAAEGQQLAAYESIIFKSLSDWLALVDRLVPARLKLLRVVIAFMILRPFDIWPSIWNRYVGTAFVALRERRNVESVLKRSR